MSNDKDPAHWPRLALLDVLRPPQGWQATDVLLSTYSLDLTVLVSGLLALTDRDTAEGNGSKVGLAHAIHHFRPDGPHRLAVLVQGGRIVTPRSSATVLALLDRFVREMQQDQRRDSWHAKVALVRFAPETVASDIPEVEWRLWIGSRNLTRDMSWDTGLVLCSTNGAGKSVPGIDAVAQALLQQSGWDKKRQARLSSEIKRQHWHTPEGVEVNSIAWLNGTQGWRPALPDSMDELVVVTPFFDMESLRFLTLAGGDSVRRTLLTTQMELDRRLAGTKNAPDGWKVFCLGSSEQGLSAFSAIADDDANASTQSPEPLTSEDEDCPIGLHAKLIAARRGEKVWLMMGSANMTQRAWQRNNEVVAVLEGEAPLWEGIEALLGLERDADLDHLPERPEKTTQHWLEDFRNGLCNMRLQQIVKDGVVEVTADRSPFQLLTVEERKQWQTLGMRFELAPLGGVDADHVSWPTNQTRVSLHQQEHSLAGESEMLSFRLIADGVGEDMEAQLSWIQRVPLDPPPDSERDRRILARYLNPQQFLSWISGMLEVYESDPEPWGDERTTHGKKEGGQGAGRQMAFPSIEALLRAWQRDRRSVEQVADTLNRYFDARTLQSHHRGEDRAHVEALERFRQQLEQIRQALGAAGA